MRQKEKIKRIRRGQSPGGGGPPQTTSSLLLWEVRGKLGPRGSTPSSGGTRRLLLSSASQHRLLPLPCHPTQGKGLHPQYLLIPKIRTPWSCGSLGMSTLIKDTVLRMKWIWSYLV